METLLYLLPALGCGLMMVVMMVFMRRGMAPRRSDGAHDNPPDEVAAPRHDVDHPCSAPADRTRVDG